MNFGKRAHLVSSIEIGRILRTTRRYTGHTQVEMARELGVEQSAYSRIESGDQGLTTSQWFRFCEVTNMVPEAVRTGVIEFYAENGECPKKDTLIAHRFKIPARYQHDAASSVRSSLPFLNYAEKVWGERKADSFIETMGVSREFFMVLNNRININFCIDFSKALIEKGDLNREQLDDLVTSVTDPRIHGVLRYRYEGAKTSLEMLSCFVDNIKSYDCNFKYEMIGKDGDRMTVAVSPEAHLEKFSYREDPTLGSFLCDYKKAYFKKFSTFAGHRGVGLEEKECHYQGSKNSKCVYEIRQLS